MTAPVIVFADAQLATRDLLRTLLAPHRPDATVSTRNAPTDDNGSPRPWVRVRAGTPQRTSRVSASATVRLTVYASDEGAALSLAALVEGLLLAEATSDRLLGFGPIGGPTPGTDPETREPLALVTLAARLRPRQL
ncbi:hypothetical protein MTE01_28860 [Microbacterium testaceum]|uniref:Tail terminator n=1 Tax=Microbacterium testaceum TaxID=2033 RepID=A0A4Y3QP77_MICTE|nr:hypothetical protein [Microbacterium testaceum]GEB46941.1 hypothetical protein MTE01_28860 [Microbacterium testaceum]